MVRAKRSLISPRFRWIAGTRMCDGQSPSSWRMSSAKSVSSASMPAAPSAPLSSISSVVSDFTFTTSAAPCARATSTTTAFASDASRAQRPRPPAVSTAGGRVHWARDASEANAVVVDVARAHGAAEVVKVKSLTTDEIELNGALGAAGIEALETDFAELILQLDGDWPSHILVPAIHRNRGEIRDLFARTIAPGLTSDNPENLAEAARLYLRERFLAARVGVSGANFGVAETGTIVVVESEGNGRMCTTLPPVLVTVLGIEKLVPTFGDLEVFLQLLPRSSTGERMNPYTSLWTGVTADDGPQELHVVILDAGRTNVLRDEVGRQALQCIRCSACLNVCPVYSRTGGHAYGSVYPGPIGAILTPQLLGIEHAPSLPFASTLCGACYEVCPVKIDIPSVLLHLRGEAVEAKPSAAEAAAMRGLGWVFGSARRFALAQRLGRIGQRTGIA